MSNTILKIGSVDMSDMVICEEMTVDVTPVFSDEFTAVTGKQHKSYKGDRIDLSAEFRVLSQAVANAVTAACRADTVTVVYLSPAETTTSFDRPRYSCVPVFEDDGHVMYRNISVSMTCPLKKGDGL